MSTRVVLGAAAVMAVAAPVLLAGQSPSASATAAAASASYTVPLTEWGHPDLQGTWDYRTITPLERPRQYGDRAFLTDEEVKQMETRAARRMDEPPPPDAPASTIHAAYWTDPGRTVDESRRTSLIVDPPDGRIPAITDEARKRQAASRGNGGGPRRAGGRADSWLDRTPLERCITWGLPTAILPGLYNNNIRIVQSPDYVAITHEMVHDTRVIPLDGRPFPSKVLGQWMGHSRAWWEGNTLVVQTTNFSDKISYRGATTDMMLTERFTRVAPDKVEFRLTVEDPATWTAPWTVAMSMRTSEGPIYEYACHEGNYGLVNILEVARDEEKAAAAAAAGQK